MISNFEYFSAEFGQPAASAATFEDPDFSVANDVFVNDTNTLNKGAVDQNWGGFKVVDIRGDRRNVYLFDSESEFQRYFQRDRVGYNVYTSNKSGNNDMHGKKGSSKMSIEPRDKTHTPRY